VCVGAGRLLGCVVRVGFAVGVGERVATGDRVGVGVATAGDVDASVGEGPAAGCALGPQPADTTSAASTAETRRIAPRQNRTARTLSGIVLTRRLRFSAGYLLAIGLALTGCGGGHRTVPFVGSTETTLSLPSETPTPSPTPTATRTPTPSAKPTPTPAASPPPTFRSSVTTVTAASLGKSWHDGCPVGPDRLRALTVTYWGFDARAHTGTLIVATVAVSAMTEAWRRMYDARFPIRKVVPVSAYGGDDNKSMAADNTSAFNCRYAVADGPKHWSAHAYGQAVDIDPYENPYTLDGRVYPPGATTYTHRDNVRPGMIVPGSAPVRAFSAVGWGWGGRWSNSPDYQHFSASGG